MSKSNSSDLRKIAESLGETQTKDTLFARTGCLMLDLLCGGGRGLGIPYGTMFSIVADTQIGKTFLAQEIIARSYWMDKEKCLYNYDDTERGNLFDTMALYGIDVIGNSPYQSDTIQELDVHLRLFLDKIEDKKTKYTHGIYVLDSLDCINTEEGKERQDKRVSLYEAGKTLDEGSYEMAKQKYISQSIIPNNGRRIADNNVLFIIISQLRDKIGATMFQQKWTISGGRAKEFAIRNRIFLKRKAKITKTVDGEEYIVGYYVEASLHKASSPRPERTACYSMYTDYGIDDIESSLSYLFNLRDDKGALKSEANSIMWNSTEGALEKNKDNVLEWVEKYNLLDDIKEKKMGTWRFNLPFIEEYVCSICTPEQKADWTATFGATYSLDALRSLIDNNPAMKAELDKRVFDKWEGIESQCRTTLKPRYGQA